MVGKLKSTSTGWAIEYMLRNGVLESLPVYPGDSESKDLFKKLKDYGDMNLKFEEIEYNNIKYAKLL